MVAINIPKTMMSMSAFILVRISVIVKPIKIKMMKTLRVNLTSIIAVARHSTAWIMVGMTPSSMQMGFRVTLTY